MSHYLESQKYINTVNNIINNLGSTILAHASSYFNEISIGMEQDKLKAVSESKKENLPQLISENNITLDKEITYLSASLKKFMRNL